jgi:hypothetical protein
MTRWLVTIELTTGGNIDPGLISAFADTAIAEACDADMEDPVAGFDGYWGSAKAVPADLLLCDECWENETGLLAVCQDVCNLSLDHDGECASHGTSGQTTCDRCGKTGRLTRREISP